MKARCASALIKVTLTILALPLMMMAADPEGYKYWSADELKAYTKTLGAKVGPAGVAIDDRIIDRGGYFAAMVHRNGKVQAEMHDEWGDLYVISTGTATLIVGGTIPGGKVTAPGEIRGPAIEGGTRQKLSPGDIVHIPAKTPHDVVVEPGGQITYFIFKVKER